MTLSDRVLAFSKLYKLEADEDSINALEPGQRHEIEWTLYDAYCENNGFHDYAETGCSPSEYLPQIIDKYLEKQRY